MLCATDLSLEADEALRQASRIAEDHGALLMVQHVIGSAHPRLHPAAPRSHGEGLAALTLRVHQVTGRAGRDVVLEVDHGDPAATIVARADASGAELLVIGGRAHDGLERLLLGATGDKLVRHAPCPVLVARPGPVPAAPLVLAGTDFSEAAADALALAAQEARRRQAGLVVAHAVDTLDPAVGDELGYPLAPGPQDLATGQVTLDARARDQLRAALEAGRLEDAEPEVVHGDPATALLTLAERLRPALIVVGTSGRTGLARLLLGSVAERIVRHAAAPVLVVRTRTAEAASVARIAPHEAHAG